MDAFRTGGRPTRVLLADELPAMRAGIAYWPADQRDVAVVGETVAMAGVAQLTYAFQPDVVLMSSRLRDGTSFSLCRGLLTRRLVAAVLLLDGLDWDGYLATAWTAGASGVLPRTIEKEELVAAIRQAARGLRLFTPEQQQRIRMWEQEIGAGLKALTRRERDVLGLMADGRSTKGIAAALVVSEPTVSKHIRAIYGKLRVRSRAELLALLLRNYLRGGRMGPLADVRQLDIIYSDELDILKIAYEKTVATDDDTASARVRSGRASRARRKS
jgi:DNA-binding NarL/FixJ family response regulator